MNNYIRTKDNVYKVGATIEMNNNIIEYDCSKIISNNDFTNTIILRHIKITDVIKEADTIEELCDEFVYIEYKKPRVLDSVITREIKEKGIKVAETIYCHPNWNGIIYGAIWTDKGLIYVAKMNDKGEMELL